MLPLEFVIPHRPISQQVRRRERLRDWKSVVAEHARRAISSECELTSEPVALRVLYLFDQAALDVDNLLKPIQDALIGVVLDDDANVTDVEIRRRWIGTAFTLHEASPVLVAGLALRRECVHVSITDAPPQDVLP